MKLRHPAVLAASVAALLAPAVHGQLASTSWLGDGATNAWSDPANWDAGIPGGNVRDLLFGTAYGASLPLGFATANNDIAGYTGHRITFQSGSATSFTMTGNALSLISFAGAAPRIQIDGAGLEVSHSINLSGRLTLDGTGGGGFAEINANRTLFLNGSTVIDLAGTTQLRFGGVASIIVRNGITSTGNLGANTVAINGYDVSFRGANSYTGDTFINAGTLTFEAGSSNASAHFQLGDTSGTASARLRIHSFQGGAMMSAPIVVRAGSTGTKTISSGYFEGTNTFSGPVTLNDDATVEVSADGLVLSGDISGPKGLIKTDYGTAFLTGTNSFAGGLTINDGAIGVAADSYLGVAGGALKFNGGALRTTSSFTLGAARSVTLGAAGGTFSPDNGTTLVIGHPIGGTGGLNKSGNGILQLNAAGTFAGAVTVTDGILLLNTSGTAVPASGLSITSKAYPNSNDIDASVQLLAANQIHDSAPVTISANNQKSAFLDLNGFTETIGALTVSTLTTGSGLVNGVRTGAGGTLVAIGDITFNHHRNNPGNNGREILITATGNYGTPAAGGGTLDLGGARTITVNPNHTQANPMATIETVVTNGGITKEGAGWLSLDATNTFTGGITINGGRVRLNTNVLNGFTGGITVNSGGTFWLYLNGSSDTDFNNAFGPASNSITLNGGTMLAAFANPAGVDRTMTDHAVIVGPGGGTIEVTAGSYTNFTASSQNYFRLTTTGSTFTGSGTLTKNGGGTLALNSDSPSYRGAWIVNNGTLDARPAGRLGDGAAANTVTVKGGTLEMLGTYTQDFTLAGGGLAIGDTILNGTASVTASSYVFLQDHYAFLNYRYVSISANLTINGVLSGSAGLNVAVRSAGQDFNADSLILTHEGNTYTGTITVGKNLRLENNAADGSGRTIGPGGVVLASGRLVLRDNGTGSGGTLAYGNNVTLTTPTGLLNNGAIAGQNTLDVNRSSGTNTGNTFQLGKLTFDTGISTLDVIGRNGYGAHFTGQTTFSGNVTINATTGDLALTGGNIGGVNLTKTGAGRLTLGGAGTYSGTTTINGGSVVFNSPGAIGGAGASVTVNAGAAAAGYAIDQAFLGRIASGSTGVIAAGADSANNINLTGYALRFGAVGTATYTGTLTPATPGTYRLGGGGGTLIIPTANYFTGAVNLDLGTNGAVPGVVALTAANNFTGSITLKEGQLLRPQGNASLGNAANTISGAGGGIQFAAGAPFDLFAVRTVTFGTNGFILDTHGNDYNPSVALTGNAGAGAFTKAGAGTLTLDKDATYTGVTNLTGGVLSIDKLSRINASASLVFGGGTLRYTGETTTLAKTITFTNTPDAATVDVASAATNLMLGGTLSGGTTSPDVALIKTGPGTLTLTTSYIFSGSIVVNQGVFAYFGQSGGSFAKSITIQNGATLRPLANYYGYNNFTTVTSLNIGPGGAIIDTPFNETLLIDDAGQVAGTGNLTKIGAGSLQLGGAPQINYPPYTGKIFVNAGTLLAVDFDTTTHRFLLDGATVATNVAGGATLDVRGRLSEKVNLASGASFVNNGGADGVYHGVLTAAGDWNVGGSGTLTIHTAIAGSGTMTRTGTGTTTLTAADSYAGSVNVAAGTLALAGATGTLHSASAIHFTGGTLLLNNDGGTDVISAKNEDRLGDTTPINLTTGALELRGVNRTAADSTSETVGVVNFDGQGLLRTNTATPTFTTTTLHFTLGARSHGGVLFIQPSAGGTLGTTDRFVPSNAPALIDGGMVSPVYLNPSGPNFLTCRASGFADAAFTSTDLATSTANSIVDQGATAVALSAPATAAALRLGTGAVSGNAVTLGTGGLIANGTATHSASFAFNNGPQTGEGIVFVASGASAALTGQVTASALTKVGSGELVLNSTTSAITAGGLNNALISVLGGTLRIASNLATNNNAALPFSTRFYSAPGSTTIFQAASTISSLTGGGTVQVGTDVYDASALTLTLNNNVNEIFTGTLQSDEADQNDIQFIKGGIGSFTLNGTVQIGRTIQAAFGELILTGTANPNLSTSATYPYNLRRQRIVALQGGTFTIDNSVTNSADRLYLDSDTSGAIIQLSGGTLNYYGNHAAASTETVGVSYYPATAPNFGPGADTINLVTGSGQSVGISVGLPFTRTAGASALLRGTNLGGTRGAANTATFAYTTNPAAQLVGAGGALGTTTTSIFRGLIADSVIGGLDTHGLATYDAGATTTFDTDDVGIRRLTAAELAPNITPGSTVLHNVRLTAASTRITGATTINALHLDAGGSIDGAGTLTINSGTILAAGGANGGIGTNTPGILAFGANEAIIFNPSPLTIGSAITASAGLTKGGAGVLTLTGPNGFTGAIIVNGGLLSVGSLANGNFSNSTNNLTLNNGGGLRATATMTLARTINLGNAGGVIDVPNAGDTLTMSGVISGNLGTISAATAGLATNTGTDPRTTTVLTKTGAGTLLLTALETYNGRTEVNGGTLLLGDGVSGSLFSKSHVAVNSGGTLGGSGTIGGSVTVNSGGTLAPGNSPGTLGTGDLSFASGSTFSLELNGLTGGTQYDRVNVTGGVSLTGGNVQITLGGGFTPTVNQDVFYVILNDGADAVSGTFAGLPQGATLISGGRAFQISYDSDAATGGLAGFTTPGNDVALLAVVPEPGSVVSLVDGIGMLLGLQRFRRRR